jgi:hypothetical protein
MARLNAPKPETGNTPAPLETPTDARPKPNLDPSPRFVLLAHPNRYTVMCGKLIPQLKRFVLEPGVNGVDKHGAWHGALASQQQRGWILIPEDVDGQGTTYLRVDEVPQGVRYRLKWEQVWAGSNRIGSDEEGYAQWASALVTGGKVPPPPLHVLEALSERYSASIEQLAARVHAAPTLQTRIDRIEADLAVVTAEITAQMQDLPPLDGAAPPEQADPVAERVADLMDDNTKADLKALASAMGLGVSGTAKAIATRIAKAEVDDE